MNTLAAIDILNFEQICLKAIYHNACAEGESWFYGKPFKEAYEELERIDWLAWLISVTCVDTKCWLFNFMVDPQTRGKFRTKSLEWIEEATRITVGRFGWEPSPSEEAELAAMADHLREQYSYEEFVTMMWADYYNFCVGEDREHWRYVIVVSPCLPPDDFEHITELAEEKYGTWELVPESFHDSIPLTYVFYDGETLTEIATI